MSDRVELGRALAALRAGRGWTQDELARRSGVAKAQISRYERGAGEPSHGSLERLLDGLGASREHLARLLALLDEVAAGAPPPGSGPRGPAWPLELTRLLLGGAAAEDPARSGEGSAGLEGTGDPEADRLARQAGALVERLVRLHFQRVREGA